MASAMTVNEMIKAVEAGSMTPEEALVAGDASSVLGFEPWGEWATPSRLAAHRRLYDAARAAGKKTASEVARTYRHEPRPEPAIDPLDEEN